MTSIIVDPICLETIELAASQGESVYCSSCKNMHEPYGAVPNQHDENFGLSPESIAEANKIRALEQQAPR
jgi:hypothetical protein